MRFTALLILAACGGDKESGDSGLRGPGALASPAF